jgi:hypothetical protein
MLTHFILHKFTTLCFYLLPIILVAQQPERNKNWQVGIDLGFTRLFNYTQENMNSSLEKEHLSGLRNGLSFGAELNYKLNQKHHVGINFKGVITSKQTLGFDEKIISNLVFHDINRETIHLFYIGPSYTFNFPLKKTTVYAGTGGGIVFLRQVYKYTTSTDGEPRNISVTKIRGNRFGLYSKLGFNHHINPTLKFGLEVGFMYNDIRKTKYIYEEIEDYETTPLNPLIFDNLSVRLVLKKDISFKNIFKRKN